MARSTRTSFNFSGPAKLVIPLNDARERLVSRREQGLSLFNAHKVEIVGFDGLEQAESAFKKWNDYNGELLRRIFTTEEYAKQYNNALPNTFGAIGFDGPDFHEEKRDYLEKFKYKLEYLDSISERLDLIEVDSDFHIKGEPALPQKAAKKSSTKKVFLVHGQDNETKAIVARFIAHCGLEPIILHEQADEGRTIIEKFEQNSEVAFAVILLTPDDIGGFHSVADDAQAQNLRARARQNVILELGYFIGKLGRKNVCALKRGDIEIPSDFSGVIYTPYDGADEGWKMKLAREMRAAGLDIDLNQALG